MSAPKLDAKLEEIKQRALVRMALTPDWADVIEAAIREAVEAAQREVIAKANEAWPDGYDEPANNAADLKCRIKDLMLEISPKDQGNP